MKLTLTTVSASVVKTGVTASMARIPGSANANPDFPVANVRNKSQPQLVPL